MTKKNILIVVFIFIISAIGYFYFLRKPNSTTTTPSTNTIGIFPFGSQVSSPQENTTPGNTSGATAIPENNNQPVAPASKLFRVSLDQNGTTIPVTGAVAFANGSTTLVRYVERGTSHIFEITDDVSHKPAKEIVNSTIPKVYESIFLSDAKSLYLRYFNEDSGLISTFYGTTKTPVISATSTAATPQIATLDGAYLPINIESIVSNGARIFYLQNNAGRGAGTLVNADGTKASQIFDSPLTEWLPQWPEANTIALTTKPSAIAPGFLYFLNVKTNLQKKILGPIEGLTTLVSPDAGSILYSESSPGRFATNLFNLKTGQVQSAPLQTLPEKCVWSVKGAGIVFCAVPRFLPSADYPDDWYQGSVSFVDSLWKIDTKTGETNLLYDGTLGGVNFDGVKLALDPNENYLFFTNKTDSVLWALKLK